MSTAKHHSAAHLPIKHGAARWLVGFIALVVIVGFYALSAIVFSGQHYFSDLIRIVAAIALIIILVGLWVANRFMDKNVKK